MPSNTRRAPSPFPRASTEDEFNKLLSSEKFDLILSDFNILGFDES